MAAVEIRLLGEPVVTVGGRPVDVLTTPRLLSLIGLLVVNRATPLRRQRVAFGLWPDSTESQARTNLRQSLHHLRRALPDADAHLDIDGSTLAWRVDSPACIDLVALARRRRSGRAL